MATYYIDQVNGNDTWTGTLPVPTPTISPTDGPFKEITKLRGKAMNGAGDNKVYLENGSHWTYDPMNDSFNTLNSVVIAGVAGGGQFSCTASILVVGMTVTLSGSMDGPGTISPYTTPQSYLISVTNGSTTFTLTTATGSAVTTSTTAGQSLGAVTFFTTAVIDPLRMFGGLATNNMDMRSVFPGKCGFSNYDRAVLASPYDRGVKKTSMPTISCYHDCVAGDWAYKTASVDTAYGPNFGAGAMTGTNTLTLSVGAYNLDVGMEISGPSVPAGLTVTGRTSATVYTMSGTATFTAANATAIRGLHPGWYFDTGSSAFGITTVAIKYGPGFSNWIHFADPSIPNKGSTSSTLFLQEDAKGFTPSLLYGVGVTGTGVLFISSPIGVNPVTHYNGVRVLIGAVFYSYDRMQNGIIENINFENVGNPTKFGSGNTIAIQNSVGMTDCTVNNCEFSSVANFCQILFQAGAAPGMSVRLTNNVGSGMGFFVSAYGGTIVMGPSATNNIKELLIEGNTLRDCNKQQWNGPIYISTKAVAMTQIIRGNRIYDCESGWDCGQREYDGGAIYLELGCHNALVSGNYIVGALTGLLDNSGGANTWIGNFAKNVRTGASFDASAGVGSIYSDYLFKNNTLILKDDYDNRMIVANHRGGHWAYALTGTATVQDNIFVADPNFNYGTTYPCIFQLALSGRTYTNNYTAPAVGSVGFGLKSTANVYDAGVIQTDPLVDTNGRLAQDSPCIGASTRRSGMIDATRIKFRNPSSIGAYEYRGMTTRAIRA
jgi:hypothetical protein